MIKIEMPANGPPGADWRIRITAVGPDTVEVAIVESRMVGLPEIATSATIRREDMALIAEMLARRG